MTEETKRRRSMAAHPAGKQRPNLGDFDFIHQWPAGNYSGDDGTITMAWHQRDDQDGVDELLARVTAAPLPEFEEEVYELASELAATLISKQQDYGPRAVNDAPGGPTLGVLVRAHDKLARLNNLTGGREGLVNNEAIRDSWLDLAGYAFIGLMVHEGTWPR